MKLQHIALSIIAMAATAVPALANRTSTVETDHRYGANLSVSDINGLVADGFRMHDIEVTQASPLRFSASFVKNSGSYAKAWWWTADKTAAELLAFMNERNARCIDLEVYTVNGSRRYAGTFILNSGDDAVGSQLFEQYTFNQLQSQLNAYNGRLIDLDVRDSKGERRYSGVMIKNSGAFAKSSVFFGNRTKAEVDQLVAQTGMQLVDLERIASNRYAGIMESNPGAAWWYQVGRSWSQLQMDVGQFGARVADIERYSLNGENRYNAILINNSNALETRVGQQMRAGTDGITGFYARQVGGPILAELLPDFRFYPASTIKMIQHMYWCDRIDQGLSALSNIRIYNNSTADTHGVSDPFTLRSIQLTQRNMMLVSSNSDANALQDAAANYNGVAGRKAIMDFAYDVVGLDADIQLNHKFADGGIQNDPYNKGTAREFSRMMERAMDGTFLSPEGTTYLRANMLNESNNSGLRNGLRTVVFQEGQAAGRTNANILNYWNLVELNWKSGNNGTTNVSSAGWVRLPFVGSNGRIGLRTYVASGFIEGASVNAFGFDGIATTAMPELLREQVRATMATFSF
jgi:hypothetical protein